MKFAFSSTMCPDLDLETLAGKSRDWGYDGFDVLDTPGDDAGAIARALRHQPEEARRILGETGQQITALRCGALPSEADAGARKTFVDHAGSLTDAAALVGCPLVIVEGPPLLPGVSKQRLLERCAAMLAAIARRAGSNGVMLAIENTGVVAKTADLWFVHDAAGAPELRTCLHLDTARAVGEPASVAAKRMRASLAYLRLTSFPSDPASSPTDSQLFTPANEHDPWFVIELMKGLIYGGVVAIENPAIPPEEREQFLAASATYLAAERDKPVVELVAYKGDKNAPRFATAESTANA